MSQQKIRELFGEGNLIQQNAFGLLRDISQAQLRFRDAWNFWRGSGRMIDAFESKYQELLEEFLKYEKRAASVMVGEAESADAVRIHQAAIAPLVAQGTSLRTYIQYIAVQIAELLNRIYFWRALGVSMVSAVAALLAVLPALPDLLRCFRHAWTSTQSIIQGFEAWIS